MDKKIWNFNTFDDSFKDDLRVFVGPRVDTYIKRWTAMGHRKNKMISWHWPAFFVEGGWAGYRQTMTWAWVYIGITVIFKLIQDVTHLSAGIFNLATTLLLSIVYALFSNYLYLDYAVKRVTEIRQAYSDPNTRQNVLKKDGGVRWSKFWLFLGILIIIDIALSLLNL
jgi:Protein of unknown function (DUF2628).